MAIDVSCTSREAAAIAQSHIRTVKEAGLPVTPDVVREAMRAGWSAAKKLDRCAVPAESADASLAAVRKSIAEAGSKA